MANYNKITYKGRIITDENLAIGGNLTNNMMLYQALISEELKPDTFTFNLIYDKNKLLFLQDSNGKYLQDSNGKFLVVRADEFDPEDMTFGDPLNYYINNGGTLMGKWYVRTVRRVQKKIYRFECMSAIGLLAYYGHDGGIYNRARFADVVASLMGSIPYTIQSDLAEVAVTGWLPKVQAAKDNLKAVLFMSGGCVRKASNGNIYFGYPDTGTPKTVQDTSVGVGGTISQFEPATRVEVTAHEYTMLSTTESKTLFDNSVSQLEVTRQTVVFDGPYHSLDGGGLTIVESGPNYAVVTGIGTLTGKPYLHTTSVYSVNTGVAGQPNVIQIENNYLVNSGNVMNVAKRVAGYYGVAKEASYTMRLNGEMPGDKIAFTDPFDEPKIGHIKSMNVTLSKNLNAQATVAINWTPGPFGGAYNKSATFNASNISNGRLTIPSSMVGKQALVVLFGGAGGGQAGFDGGDGNARKGHDEYENPTIQVGGKGGEGGAPGERGNIISFYVDALPTYYDGAVIGEGGAGGTSNGELGQMGTATTLGEYSSDDGSQLLGTYENFLDGTTYAEKMLYGYKGGWGGRAYNHGEDAVGDIGAPCIVRGGNPTNWEIYWGNKGANGNEFRWNQYSIENGAAGGGGGAYGASDAGEGQVATKESAGSLVDAHWTLGGNGANALPFSFTAPATCTGYGGNGGGGGGGASLSVSYNRNTGSVSYGYNTAGTGGKGSAGGKGGDGLILIYYNE